MAKTDMAAAATRSGDDARQAVLRAAAALLSAGGADALTTRAVARAAGVQAPTLYRLFGDKQGLLDALAEQAMLAYAQSKRDRPPSDDPLAELREAWDEHIAFGLSHPALYHLMSAAGRGGVSAPTLAAAIAMLRERVRRAAVAGLLRVPEERAVGMIHAAGTGTVIALLEQPPERRDPGLAIAARDAVMAAIAADAAPATTTGLPQLAVTLRARIGVDAPLTPGERLLLDELLARIGGGGEAPAGPPPGRDDQAPVPSE